MLERWIEWRPITNVPSEFYSCSFLIEDIVDTLKILHINLSEYDFKNNEGKIKLRIIFEGSVIAYRSADDTLRHKSIEALCEDREKYMKHNQSTFFKVENSQYAQFIARNNSKIDITTLTHFCIGDINYILDIIATKEPKIEIENINIEE